MGELFRLSTLPPEAAVRRLHGRAPMNVAVIFYSLYGETAALAAAVAEGAGQAGATVRVRQVARLEAREAPGQAGSEKIRATREHLDSVPLAGRDDLLWADGIAFGSPARYGVMSAELRRFLDGSRQLSGDLAGKLACVFCSPAPIPGAQRATLHGMITSLLCLGVLVQPPARAEMETAVDPAQRTARHGGPPRASAGEGPTGLDLAPARALGRRLARAERRTCG